MDRDYKMFRFQNSWHYIVSGEFFEFPRARLTLRKDNVEDIEVVWINALQDTSNGTYLYQGVLVDYELAKDGGLNSLSLKFAQRRHLSLDENGNSALEERYYPIKGHMLVLKYPELKNLNFTYYKIIKTEDDELTPVQVS